LVMAEKKDRRAQLKEILAENPGAPEFVELASLLADDAESRFEARELCFRGLSENPDNSRGRLMLARLFYLDGYAEFCVRELAELKRRVKSEAVDRLIDAFGDIASPYLSAAPTTEAAETEDNKPKETAASTDGEAEEEAEDGDAVFAEIDLDEDFVDALEELEDED